MNGQQRFGDDRSDVLMIVTTEHFTLQTARSAAVSEITGRAGMFLSTVSIALVALAFVGQDDGLRAAFSAFGTVTLLMLFFLGVVTFERTLQASIDDIATTQRINRLHLIYVELFPELRDYLPTTVPSGGVASRVHGGAALRPTQWQLLLSVSGMVGVINSLIAALLVGVAADRALGANVLLASSAATLTFLAAVAVHQRVQMVRKRPYLSP